MRFAQLLRGGDRRSLQGVPTVIQEVRADPKRVVELFDCVFDDDEIVRMRAADALEKVCREEPARLTPFVERMLTDMAASRQPSVQWHLAQLLGEVPLTPVQRDRAAAVVQEALDTSSDWIVVTCALETLAAFTRQGAVGRDVLQHALDQWSDDPRKAVRSKVRRLRREAATDGPPG